MDSTSLQARGVNAWVSFRCDAKINALEHLPTAFGVYVILLGDFGPRRRGQSDIAYIGKATNRGGLRGRVRQYFHPGPTQSTNIAMNRRLNDPDCVLRIGFLVCDSAAAARRLESDLLIQFEAQHGELPPYNRQRALDLIGRGLPGTEET